MQAVDWGDEEEEGGMRVAKRGKRSWEEGSEDDAEARKEREEEEEREDQREKEEFAERLRLKDEEKTRKIMEAKVSKEQMQVTSHPWPPLWHMQNLPDLVLQHQHLYGALILSCC